MSSHSPSPLHVAKKALRRQLRQARRSLPAATARANAIAVARSLLNNQRVTGCRCIAGYVASDGELDLEPTLKALSQRGIDVVLPALTSREDGYHMLFRQLVPDRLELGPFNLMQPDANCPSVPTADIDLVLLPLVGYDANGNRLGMGGGYYDRTFVDTRAIRIGIAHAMQRIDSLPHEQHDLRLHAVATEVGLAWFDPADPAS